MLTLTIERFDRLKYHGISCREIEESISWLKSLCPQPKAEWSEDDENNLNKLLQLDGIPLGLRSWVSGLPKKVGTRSSWKPSKEEMEALDVACSGKLWYGEIYLEGLKRIREQLRKLCYGSTQ